MKEYRTLARLFHADRTTDAYANHERLARERLEDDATFRTGVITPIGELFIATPRETTMLTERILLAENRIARLWERMPGLIQWDYIRHYISEEIFATNQMEGVRSTRRETELAVAAAEREDDTATRTRFREFARLYLNLTDRSGGFPKTLEDIRSIYDRIALDEIDVRDRPDGRLFRKGDVEIQGPHGTPIHVGVSGEEHIGILLTGMIDLADSDRLPRIQRAIVAHFLFEYIHPFYDGNGRTGRYLLALHLHHDLTLPTVLSLSRVIAEHKNAYYKAFTEAEDRLNRGELTFFTHTMLGFITTAQDELIDQLGVKTDQLAKARTLCDTLTREHGLSVKAGGILYQVMQEELFDSMKTVTLEDAAQHLNLSKQSVRKYVTELDRAGLIAFTGRRPLRFRASPGLRQRMGGAAGNDHTSGTCGAAGERAARRT